MKDEIREELKNMASELLRLKEKTKAEVEESYFESLPNRILVKEKGSIYKPMQISTRKLMAIAASFAFMILIVWIWNEKSKMTSQEILSIDDFEESEVLNYLGNNVSDIDPELLWDYSLLTDDQKDGK